MHLYSLIPLFIIAFITGAYYERRTGLPRAALVRANLPWKTKKQLQTWFVPSADQGWGWAIAIALTTLAVTLAITTYGIGAGVWTLVFCVFAGMTGVKWGGAWCGPYGNITPHLRELAHQARAAAATRGEPARVLADWIDALCDKAPHLTRRRLENWYTLEQVAAILEVCFLEEDDDGELEKWLDTPSPPLWEGPEEQRRVALLSTLRSELAAEGGEHFAAIPRVHAMIEQLYREAGGLPP